jgi:hypothetical protein
MDMWMKVVSALLMGMMVIFLWPRAKHMIANSPKATGSDWKAVLIPLLGVVLFVMLLISMV